VAEKLPQFGIRKPIRHDQVYLGFAARLNGARQGETAIAIAVTV